ncbi:MAG TPA: PVC-type heme-binding CxxCH protein, partial [Verrucomicrobiae bacterium]|nr:PVC-type heme-binding CxxCH protein [Verrucomicrobiae bacterium]
MLLPLLISPVLRARAIDGPLTPEDSLKYLRTEPGCKVELVASEPMVIDPVAVAWDEKGRMYVVEDRGYPIGPGKGKRPVGQIVLLEDTDGDGKYDKRTVFADGLTFPNGVMPWKGGVYVTCAPYLYYFKDTDGDGKADVKQIVFKGFQDLSTTQLRVSHPMLNIDNWVYLTSGLTSAKVTAPGKELAVVTLNHADSRFRPGTQELQPTAGMAQFGQTFDSFGRKFICSNRNHIREVVMDLEHLKRNPFSTFTKQVEDISDHEAACRVYPLSANITTAAFHAGYITSACGITIFQGGLLPAGYYGNSFTCEPAGNLVHRDVLEPNGSIFLARRAYPTNEFLASPDNWFRPVDLANGPDGALYVCDMYRKTIEHPDYLPEATRKVTDFESGKTMGRIYRVVAENTREPAARRFDLSKASSRQLLKYLENTNVWWRMTAQRLILERQDLSIAPELREMVASGRTPVARVHALRCLEALGVLGDSQIAVALRDKDPNVREQGLTLAEPRLDRTPNLWEIVLKMDQDPSPRVRFECALALGAIDEDTETAPLVSIANRDLDDEWTLGAVLSSITFRQEAFLRAFLASATFQETGSNHTASLSAFMNDLGHIVAAASPEKDLPALLGEILLPANGASAKAWQMAAAGGFGKGLRDRDSAQKESLTLTSVCDEDSARLKPPLDALFQKSTSIALSESQPLGAREAALDLLAQADYATAKPALQKLIDPRQPSEIQTAAIRTLVQFTNADIATVLVDRDRWNGYTPAVRDVVLSALMANTNYLNALFTAVENGAVPAWTVNEDRRTQLMRHKDETIRARATKLFKDLAPMDRMKVYEETEPVLKLKPNSKNGHAVFTRICTACHMYNGEGHLVGPDLTGIRNQPPEVLLLHIVVPEYEIMPIYTCYNVLTKSGESYTGILAAETPSAITLRMAQGVERQIPRSDID